MEKKSALRELGVFAGKTAIVVGTTGVGGYLAYKLLGKEGSAPTLGNKLANLAERVVFPNAARDQARQEKRQTGLAAVLKKSPNRLNILSAARRQFRKEKVPVSDVTEQGFIGKFIDAFK